MRFSSFWQFSRCITATVTATVTATAIAVANTPTFPRGVSCSAAHPDTGRGARIREAFSVLGAGYAVELTGLPDTHHRISWTTAATLRA